MHMPTVCVKALADLNRKFTCGSEHKCEWPPRDRTSAITTQLAQDRKRKRGCLAGPRLSTAKDVKTLERRRNRSCLNLGRYTIVLVCQCPLHWFNEVNLVKCFQRDF